ncbi:MAG: hypothetical protein LBS32_03805 [Clostridiales Family XIII bacterium]|nr:hypothetical protein [Clostridiales Family XIII bacterium]
MKQFIVLVSMTLLGVFIYGLIAGPGDDSMLASVKSAWSQEIDMRTRQP